MAAPGSDGHPQMHMGAPAQMQHQQVPQQMHVQMMGQHQVIRQQMPIQGPNIVRMQTAGIRQRPQMTKSGGMPPDQQMTTIVGGSNRVDGAGPIPQQVHVIPQGMFQQQSPQTTYITADGGHAIHTGVVEAQQRPVVTSYGQAGNIHLQTVYQVPNQMRRRPAVLIQGVQQPVYSTGIRVAQPVAAGGGVSQARFIQNSNGPSMMQLVNQGSNQIPVSQAHFIPQEVQQQQQQTLQQPQPAPQRMVLPQRPMMVIHSQQQLQGQPVRPAMIIQQQQQPQGPPSEQVIGGLTQEQQRQRYRNRFNQYIQIVDKALHEVQTQRPDFDVTYFHKLRQYLERSRDGKDQPHIPQIEQLIRQIQQNPFGIHTQRTQQQQRDQQAAQQQAAAASVSEETRQKLLAPKRNPMVITPTQHGQQRVTATSVRPGIMAPSSSGLNSLLSQPSDVVPVAAGCGVSSGRQQQQASQQIRVMLPTTTTHQQQQSQAVTQQQQQPLVDPFSADMDKLMEEFIQLEEKFGKERFNRARAEISDETRELRLQLGYLLPRDLFPPSSSSDLPEIKVISEDSSSSSLSSRKRTISGCVGANDGGEPLKRTKLYDGDNDEAIKTEQDEQAKTISQAILASEDEIFIDGKTPSDADFSEACLNPKLRAEIDSLRSKLYEVTLSVVVVGGEDCPSMEEMESHVTCQDVAEWRGSLVVKLVFEHKLLPWDVPPLFVRLSPDYLLATGDDAKHRPRINWFIRNSEFDEQPALAQDGMIHLLTRSEIAQFLKLCKQLIDQFMDPLRTVTGGHKRPGVRLDLLHIAEVWVKCLLMAVNEFAFS